MIGAIRRRAIMALAKPIGTYAITAAENPEFMDWLYHKGIAANPDYCTIQEAAAVTTFNNGVSYTPPSPILHLDLRHFINVTWRLYELPVAGADLRKFTWPARENDDFGVNSSFSQYNGLLFIVPAVVKLFEPLIINASSRHRSFIFESEVPPAFNQNRNNLGGPIDAIYVPDNAVETYKTTNDSIRIFNANHHRYYSQYADVIHPISEYTG